ncbi:EAL domain-containing protein [Aquihabitans sp. G128]|uniref:EAL domain-containing protein n=1 Tax=Aquihabitans sp. G128 TaxID=2849779 RepID=UPI001C23F4E1|nr:EAL domain-containing protein [Aquihabitans sp. G128]QXC62433.1 EAL domain-containing protein [Aquihabitans sp. G128]
MLDLATVTSGDSAGIVTFLAPGRQADRRGAWARGPTCHRRRWGRDPLSPQAGDVRNPRPRSRQHRSRPCGRLAKSWERHGSIEAIGSPPTDSADVAVFGVRRGLAASEDLRVARGHRPGGRRPMNHARFSGVLAEFARTMGTDFPIQSILDHLVDRIVELLPITGAGVTLIAVDKEPHFIAASDDDALRFERLQSDVGEGPCIAAYASRRAVVVADLSVDDRFPRFAPLAVAAGLHAVCTLPLRHEDGCLGALDLYRDAPGGLDTEDLAAAQTLADVATAYLLNVRTREEVRAIGDRHQHIALHDPLTGLPNRRLLQERIEQAAQRARRSNSTAAVLFADLDRFKVVNDSHGHRAGDELLVSVARRLSELVRSGDTLARVSGDEFVFLCEDLSDETDAERLASRVNEVFDRPFVLTGVERPVSISASVGIAYAGPGAEISDQLVVEADMAMYQVKRRGGSGHQIIDMRAAMRTVDLHRLEQDLRVALQNDQLDVHYQPISHTPDRATAGVEALLRWEHPDRGWIPPATVIWVAEQSNQIAELGAWILERACRDHRAWLGVDPELDLDLAVNVSARQLLDPAFEQGLVDILHATDMAPTSLVLEVTESTFVDHDGAAGRVLAALDERGIRLALDDFGTGFSSLSYLCRLPIHIVKIDRSFIADLDHPETKAIVSAIAGLAHDLELEIVAEGIETIDQANQVHALGCHYSQGFLLAEPVPADVIGERLAAERAHRLVGGPKGQPPSNPPPLAEVTSKRTLTVLSKVIEELAQAAGPGATLVTMFQRWAYFEPMVSYYRELARTGMTVVVGYAGPGPRFDHPREGDPVVLGLDAAHPLGNEWTSLLVTPTLAAHVVANELTDPDETSAARDGRRFSSCWGFDRCTTGAQLLRVVAALDGELDPDLCAQLTRVARQATGRHLTREEYALAAKTRRLVQRIEVDQHALADLRGSLAAHTGSPH